MTGGRRERNAQKRGRGESALAFEELSESIPDGKTVDEALWAEELSRYRVFGDFWTCETLTEGNWQVTFPLENAEEKRHTDPP